MINTKSRTAPVNPGVRAPGGSRCDNQSDKEQEIQNIMTQPIGIEQKPFEGDRYERFRQATEILAEDENVAAAELPFNGEGLRAFAADLIEMRALDGLSEHDANWAGMLACFDFCRGLPRFGWRINDMLSEEPTFIPRPEGYDNELAVLRAYVNIFGALLEPFADIDEVQQ